MAPLILFPAIDLKGGQVVRLAEGDMARATVYGDDPAAQARLFADAGASHLHVVDLDGAFAGESVNGAAVESIVAAFPGKVQVGGGISDRAGVDRWLALGVSRWRAARILLFSRTGGQWMGARTGICRSLERGYLT